MITFEPLLDTLRLQKISDEVYFSEKYSDYISNSRLSKINPAQEGSKELFLAGLQANRIFSDSLLTGSAVHGICLQPESFEINTHITNRPTGKAGFIADECLKFKGEELSDSTILKCCEIVDYYKGNPSDKQYTKLVNSITPYIESRLLEVTDSIKEQIYLSPKQMETSIACINAINSNKKIQDLLHPTGIIENPISENEQAILLDVMCYMPEPFVIRLKAKLDNYTIDKENNTITVNDIKTHGKILPEFPEAVKKYRYMRELAMYTWLLKLCAEKFYNMSEPIIKGNFLVVSTIPQYYTKVFPMNKKLYTEGFNEFKYLLRLAAQALYERSKEL